MELVVVTGLVTNNRDAVHTSEKVEDIKRFFMINKSARFLMEEEFSIWCHI